MSSSGNIRVVVRPRPIDTDRKESWARGLEIHGRRITLGAHAYDPDATLQVDSPQRDVHRVENPGDIPSVSVHVYGCDMGTQRRRRYDAATGAIEWCSTPHDSDEVVVS